MRKREGGGKLKRAAAPLFWHARLSAFDFYPREWGFPFEWRLCDSFSKHLAFDLFTHVPFMFPCIPSFWKYVIFEKYFDCLPLEIDSYELLRTLNMISESVRIVLQKYVIFKTYFDCLPFEFDSYELLRTLKMISESVRILFQKYVIFKKVFRLAR